MNDTEGYDVLRLIEHSKSCYISSEYVKGTPLIKWMKYHPDLSKEQLFLWIHEISRQLECIHKCRGKPCYRYVNPYSIIFTEKKELYFLDMNAKSNEKMLLIMRRRSVREHFLPPGEEYYQSESVFLDIYGLGKTIQYLLSVSEPEPKLTRGETAKFQKVISKTLNRHSKRAYVHVSELRKELPVYHIPKKYFTRIRLVLGVLAAFVSALAAGITVYRSIVNASDFMAEVQESEETAEDSVPNTADREGTDELKKELGFLYFLDKQDYGTGRKYFADIGGDKAAEGLADLSEYMLSEDISGEEMSLLLLLKRIERDAPVRQQEKYFLCLIEGYRLLDSEEAAEAIVRLCGVCEKTADENTRKKLTAYMAYGYERSGQMEKAVSKYMDMLSWTQGDKSKEELYKKLVLLRQEMGEIDEAIKICRQGIEELKSAAELRLIHIGMQCADKSVGREVCAQTIRRYIEEIPEIVEEEEFKKLTREYEIVMEGENIWVGR